MSIPEVGHLQGRRAVVVMVVANMKGFRVAFYESLAQALSGRGIELRVVYSEPSSSDALRSDCATLTPPVGLKVPRWYLLADRLLLQSLPFDLLWRADAVVIVQSNGYAANYFLQLLRLLGWRSLAFWGHGFNHQGVATSLAERWRRMFVTSVDWWFTHTDDTARFLESCGFPPERITVVENAVDTSRFAKAVAEVSFEKIILTRRELQFPDDATVALYCGSLYADKHLAFLMRVGDKLYQRNSNFRLIVIGDGPERAWMENAAAARNWVRYRGPQFGVEKVKLFAVSTLFLNPGVVGLSILDSFAAGLPFVTTNTAGHGPEISYLNHGVNGLILPLSVDAFVQGVEGALVEHEMTSLRAGARATGSRFTLENMVLRVADGIVSWLSTRLQGSRA